MKLKAFLFWKNRFWIIVVQYTIHSEQNISLVSTNGLEGTANNTKASTRMPVIGDSSAVLLPDRVLSQHQSALTLIKDRIENPSKTSFRWLDIACGRGQILAHARTVFSLECCRKIEYFGIDVIHEHCQQAEAFARQLFGSVKVQICEIDKFELYLQAGDRFDAITFTNTAHEISPEQLSATFVSALSRVAAEGFLFLYDMETLPSLELGAIPWYGAEIQEVFHRMLIAAGETTYAPTASTFPHKSCNGWNLHLNRGHLAVSPEILESRQNEMMEAATIAIRGVLEKKLILTNAALTSAARHRAENVEEKEDRTRLLYDYWAISRALGIDLTIPLGGICKA